MKTFGLFSFILAFALFSIAAPASASPALKGKVVALDAGHGDFDPGALNQNSANPIFEKDMNRSVKDILKEKLERNGAKVVDIRKEDEFVDLYQRAAIANASGADILISIHHNSAGPGVNGTETYYADDAGGKLAAAVNSGLTSKLKTPDRGVTLESGFVMTRDPVMPSIITEASFVTDDAEAQAFLRGDREEQEAIGLLNGINDYFAG